MFKCLICGKHISINDETTLKINNVPESTFNFSDKIIDLNIISCNYCGAVQLYDTPLSEDYDVVYRSIGLSSDYKNKKINQLKEFIHNYNLENKMVLEFGCGNGQFLDIFHNLGLNCYGIEKGESNILECLKKGFYVNKYFSDYNNDSEKFDAFCCFHYLEHLPEARKILFNLFESIKENGLGLIEVPNYDYIEKNNIWLEFTKDHRIYFRKRTLQYLLLNVGFEIESIKEDELCLTAIVKKPEKIKFISIKNKIKNDIKMFKKFVKNLNDDYIIYGAGHYSQLIINNIDIKPKKIFDSNKQKVGNKICGVLIEHKEDLFKLNNFENIIIVCGIYNNEIQNELQSHINSKNWSIYQWN